MGGQSPPPARARPPVGPIPMQSPSCPKGAPGCPSSRRSRGRRSFGGVRLAGSRWAISVGPLQSERGGALPDPQGLQSESRSAEAADRLFSFAVTARPPRRDRGGTQSHALGSSRRRAHEPCDPAGGAAFFSKPCLERRTGLRERSWRRTARASQRSCFNRRLPPRQRRARNITYAHLNTIELNSREQENIKRFVDSLHPIPWHSQRRGAAPPRRQRRAGIAWQPSPRTGCCPRPIPQSSAGRPCPVPTRLSLARFQEFANVCDSPISMRAETTQTIIHIDRIL